MKVRYLTGLAGDGFALHRGDIREVDAVEALRLIAAGYAEAVEKAQAQRPLERNSPRERAISHTAAAREKTTASPDGIGASPRRSAEAASGAPSAADLDAVASELAQKKATEAKAAEATQGGASPAVEPPAQ